MKVSASLADAGSVKRILTKKLETVARRTMADIGAEMVKGANTRIRANFDTGRAGSRRRSPGTTRAINALDFQLDGSTLPIEVRFRVRGGDAVLARIIFMNYGTSPHEIHPSGAWDGKPGGPVPALERAARGGAAKLAWFEDGYWQVADMVDHPGQDGKHFLEEARDAAVAKILRE